MNRYLFTLLLFTLGTQNINASYTTALNATVTAGSAASFFAWVQPTFDFVKTHGFRLVAMEGLNTFVVCPLPRLALDAFTATTMGYALYRDKAYGSLSTGPAPLKAAMAFSALWSGLFLLAGLVTEKTIFSQHPHDLTEIGVISRLLLDALTVVATTLYIFKR